MVTLSLAQTEDKVLALFSAGGLVMLLANFLLATNDPKYVATGNFLIALGVFLKAIISSPAPPVQTPPPPRPIVA